MNKRTASIINTLLEAVKPITINQLAEQYEVSSRTIRNDLSAINDILKENKIPIVELKSGGEIQKPEDFFNILPFVSSTDLYTYKLSKEERKMIAAALLINSVEYITLSTIADNLFVSRATIINDLDEIKEFIREGSLKVISHPNKGLRVEGLESDKRWFLFKLNAFNLGGMVESNQTVAKISVQAGNAITIQKIINEQEHLHKNFLNDDSFLKLQRYLGIMINRNMQGEYIEVQSKVENNKYRMAQDILKYICQYCKITTTEDEVWYLSQLLKNSHYINHKSSDKDAVKIQLITRQFIREVSNDLEVNLNNDYDFFENLANHLESMFSVETQGFLENPILNEIIEDNEEVLEAVKKNLHVLVQYHNRTISQIEIVYITIHVCAALERRKNSEVAFHVIVACHAGIGTSQLLIEKLKKHYNFQIVDVISSHEAENIKEDKADFIIATVPLKNCKLDYVIVSPMLSDEDYVRVGNKIDTIRNSRKLPSRIEVRDITAKGLLKELKPVIFEQAPEIASELMKSIRKVVRNYFNQNMEEDEDIFSPYLHHLLPATHIQVDVQCTDWRDAVEKSAQKLLDAGYIEERYIDAMLHNIEENGPYIVVSPGFAVPHEGLEQGSIKVGMNLIRLKNPVSFGAEEFDPVEFVCCLSAVDHKTHLKAFFNLINMLANTTFKQALRETQTPEELALVIEKYEYEIVT